MKKKAIIVVLSCCLAAALITAAASVSKAAGANAPPAGDTALISEPEAPSASVKNEEPPVREIAAQTPEESPPPLTLETVRTLSFSDVPQEDSRADCISYAAFQGLLTGVDGSRFSPEERVDLATVLTVLHRMSGQPEPDNGNTFPDVPDGAWYAGTSAWAVSAGIVTGREDGRLYPLEPITRQQLAAVLYRYAASEEDRAYDTQLSAYTDGASVADYARLPMAWSLENSLFAAMVSDAIHPGLPVSRAQLAQVLVALTAYNTQEPVAQALTVQMSAKIAVSASQSNHEDIQLLVDRTAAKYGATGLQVAVVENGRVTDAYTYGWATKNQAVMTEDHKIRAASISKVAVGMAAMLLREQGYIDLDQDIGTYWGVRIKNPSHPNTPITIRALLSHTSSIRAFDGVSRNYSAVKAQLSSPSCFTRSTPGAITSWNYNNYGYAVLGMTLELASNKYLDTVMQNALWDIMEIDAAFEGGCIQNTGLIATLYDRGSVSRTAAAQRTYVRGNTPGAKGAFFAGGLTISAKDLAKMAALLINDGYYEGLQLLKPESVELMESRYDKQLGDGTYQALPLRSQDNIYGRDRLYYHTGSAYGVYNFFSYDPAAGDGVVVLTVGASGAKDSRGIYAICGEISQYIYEIVEE